MASIGFEYRQLRLIASDAAGLNRNSSIDANEREMADDRCDRVWWFVVLDDTDKSRQQDAIRANRDCKRDRTLCFGVTSLGKVLRPSRRGFFGN